MATDNPRDEVTLTKSSSVGVSGSASDETRAQERPSLQFLADVRAVVVDHWSGLVEDRPDEAVWARLDHVLFDDEGISRVEPDYEAKP